MIARLDNRQRDRAFALVELLIVILVIAMLSIVVFASMAQSKTKTQQTACQANLHECAMAVRMFADDNADWLPPGPGSESGLAMGQAVAYSREASLDPERGNQLVDFIATYLSLPAPDDRLRRASALVCPAGMRTVEKADPYLLSYYGVCTTNYVAGTLPDLKFNPFGAPASGNPPHKMSEIAALPQGNEVFLMVDIDQTVEKDRKFIVTPAHETVRNCVYFDGRVSTRKVGPPRTL